MKSTPKKKKKSLKSSKKTNLKKNKPIHKKAPQKKANKIIRDGETRVKSGVKGFDELLGGGFIKGSSILVSGKSGSGKTIFSLQFLLEGLKNGEAGVYITLEETSEDIRKDAISFGWDLKEYEKQGKFKIIEKSLFENPDIEFFEADKIKAQRLVIDSISILSLLVKDSAALRNRLNSLQRSLRSRGITHILVSEAAGKGEFSRLGVEEYLADAVIHLEFTPIGPEAGRNIFVRKMRRTKHSEDIHPIEIGDNGIKVLSV